MGKRAVNNFTKRFGDPPRIKLTFVKVGAEEAKEDAKKVFSAYKDMLIALIGREPTHAELFGHALIPEVNEAMRKSAEPPISIGKGAMKALTGKGLIVRTADSLT